MGTSSAARVAGKIHKQVEVAGRRFLLSQTPPVGMIADIEAFILGQRIDLSAFAIRTAKKVPEKMQAAVFQGAALATAALGDTPTAEEWDRFDRSLWRPAFLFWKMLDEKHRDELPDVESVRALFEEDAGDLDTLVALIRNASRDDDLKNSSGPTTPVDRAPNQPTATPSTPAGPLSISTSPTASAGATAT